MNIYQRLAVTTAAIAPLFTAMEANPVQAALINFTVDVTSGSLAGTQSFGSFSYDESKLTGNGLEILRASEGLSISFNFLDNTYTEADEAEDFPDLYPFASFQDGQLSGLNYFVDNSPSLLFAFSNEVNVEAGTLGELGGNKFAYDASNLPIPPGNVFSPFEGVGTVTYTAVPEPSGISVLAVGIIGTGLLMKRKMDRKKLATKP